MLSWKQSRIHRAMCWRVGSPDLFGAGSVLASVLLYSGGGRNRRPKCLSMSANVTPIRMGSLPVELGKWLRRTCGTPSLRDEIAQHLATVCDATHRALYRPTPITVGRKAADSTTPALRKPMSQQ